MTGNELKTAILISGKKIPDVANGMGVSKTKLYLLFQKEKLDVVEILLARKAGIEINNIGESKEEIRLKNIIEDQKMEIQKLYREVDHWRDQVTELFIHPNHVGMQHQN